MAKLGIEVKGYGDRFAKLSTKVSYFIVDYMTDYNKKAKNNTRFYFHGQKQNSCNGEVRISIP